MIVVCSPKFSKLESEASRSRSVPHQKPEATCVHFEHDKRGPRGSSCLEESLPKRSGRSGPHPLNLSDDKSELYSHIFTLASGKPTTSFVLCFLQLFARSCLLTALRDGESDIPRSVQT